MPENWFARNPLRVLSDESVQQIHDSVISLLSKLGVRIDSDEAFTLLQEYGVRCDLSEGRAYPGEESIRQALGTVGRSYTLYLRGTDQPRALDINLTTTHAACGAAALKLYTGGQYRDTTRDDLVDAITLHQKLEHIDLLINLVEPPDMSGSHLYPELAALLFCYSSKPLLLQSDGRKDVEKLIRMASLFTGSRKQLRQRPLFSTGINAEAPLWLTEHGAEVLIHAAREGVPVSMGAYPMAGLTSPLDVAASIVQTTATILLGVVLTQAAAPGSGCDFSAPAGGCDLRTGDVITMSPGTMQLIAGLVQMGRHYNLVTHAFAPTEAKAADAQAAGERFFSLAVSVMCGASIIQGATAEMSGLELADFAQCVLDNEIAGYVFDFASGISIGGLAEAVAAIEDVVTCPDYADLKFLGHPHTAKHSHRLAYQPDLFSVGMLSRWITENHPTLYEQAEERAAELIAERQEFVTAEVKEQLFNIALED